MDNEEMKVEKNEEISEETYSAIYEHLLKARKDSADLFPHDMKVYKDFVNNYQGVRLSKRSIRALGKL